MKIIYSDNLEQTQRLGSSLGKLFQTCPAVLLMRGDLGAGKTTLSQAIVAGYGLTDPVTSPTYALMHIYGGGAFYHYDLYRLQDPGELEEIGFEEAMDEGVPVIIEWPELVADHPFKHKLELEIAYGDEPGCRKLIFQTSDPVLMEGLNHLES